MRKRNAIDAVLILGFLLVAWAPFLSGRSLLYSGDTFYYFLPYRYTLFEAVQGGYLPEWEAGALSGNAFCANPQANCFYPLSLFYLIPDFFVAYQAAVVAHLAIAALGVWFWLRDRGHSRLAALIPGLCVASGGIVLSMVNRLDKLESFSWWPFAMWGLERLVRRSRGGFAILVGALALNFLAGGLEVWGLTLVSLGIWGILAPATAERLETCEARRELAVDNASEHLAVQRETAEHGAIRSVSRHLRQVFLERWRPLTGLLLAIVVSLCVTAPQWVALRELMSLSTRASGLRFERAIEMSLRPGDLWGLLVPWLYYDPTLLSFTPAPGAPSEPRYYYGLYLGVVPVLAVLSTIPLFFQRGVSARTVRACSILIAGSLFFALGGFNPLYRPIYDLVGPLRSIRFPEKFVVLGWFFLLPLVALGIERWWRSARVTAALFGAGLGLLMALFLLPGLVLMPLAWLLQFTNGGEQSSWLTHLRSLLLEAVQQSLILTAIGAVGWCAIRGWLRPSMGRLAIGVLVAIDLWSVGRTLVPGIAPEALRSSPAFAAPLKSIHPAPRVHVLPLYLTRPLEPPDGWRGEQAYRWFWQLLYPNTGMMSGIQYADGSRAIRPDHPTRFFAGLKGRPVADQVELAALAGIEGLVSQVDASSLVLRETPGVKLIGGQKASGLLLWQLASAVPRAYVVPVARWYPTWPELLEAVLERSYSPRHEVGLVGTSGFAETSHPQSGLRTLGPKGGDADGKIFAGVGVLDPADKAVTVIGEGGTLRSVSVRSFEGGQRKVLERVDAGPGGYLVLAEAWYPGWTAKVDGAPATVLEANAYQQAVRLPAGVHTVELEFFPSGRGGALVVALIGILVTLASTMRLRAPDLRR